MLLRLIIIVGLLTSSCPSFARQYTQVAFSPSPTAIELVERNIGQAKSSVYVAAYSFTSHKVADALIKAHQKGILVKVVLDKGQASQKDGAISKMQTAGIPLRFNDRYAIMHNKYIIIDERTVETGSFNFTTSAEKRNAENVIVIRNNPQLAQKYLKDWDKLWEE